MWHQNGASHTNFAFPAGNFPFLVLAIKIWCFIAPVKFKFSNIRESQQKLFSRYVKKTSKFEWTLDNIRVEKIISTIILVQKCFLEVSTLLTARQSPKLQSWAIPGQTNDETLRNGNNPNLISNPIWGTQNFFQWLYLNNVLSYYPIQFPGKLMN